MIIDKAKGYIVTNNHVVKDADRIMVRLGPGDDVPAHAGGRRPQDRPGGPPGQGAICKVQAEWGDSDKLDIGDWVLAIGSPLGFDHSVTAGIVSATERNDVRISEYESFIQTDAAINPGKLGGPADQSGRQGRGHQHGDHHAVGRLRGDRAGHPLVAGAAGGREPDQGRQGRSRLSGSQHPAARHDRRLAS